MPRCPESTADELRVGSYGLATVARVWYLPE
jgi:hypothetical protein